MGLKHCIMTAGLALVTVYASNAWAAELLYQPTNPSFGGNALNSSHLRGLAETQNQHREERDTSARTGLDQSELFVRQLQSRLLSGLAGQVTDSIFGEDAQDSGEIVFGEQTITFDRGLEFITITIFDAATGSTTDVRVPLLQATD